MSIKIPAFSSVKQLCRLIDIDDKNILRALCVRHKKHLYSNFDGVWYRFPSMKDVIIPGKIAAQYAKKVKKQVHIHDTEADIIREHNAFLERYSPFQRGATPVIALLGHYNHGKTTLLDSLCASSYATSEVGSITQEIRTTAVRLPLVKGSEDVGFAGLLEKTLFFRQSSPPEDGHDEVLLPTLVPASHFSLTSNDCSSSSSILTDNMPVTMLDTPGQDVFFRMRNYAAAVADAVILVVAADEGISQQTQEAIGIVQGTNLPCIVCLNKIDKIADHEFLEKLNKLESEIREYEKLENAIVIPISALKKLNLQYISSAVKALWECVDSGSLKSVISEGIAHAVGVVLNNWSNSKDGTAIQIVLRSGIVRVGDHFSCGGLHGKIKFMRATTSSKWLPCEGTSATLNFVDRKTSHSKILEARPGTGIICSITVISQELSSPLGENIIFGENSFCENLMKSNVMKIKFPQCVENSEKVISELNRLTKDKASFKIRSIATPNEISEDLDIEDEIVAYSNSEDESRTSKISVVLKCQDGLMIGTVTDALNEGSLTSSSLVDLVLAEAGAVSLKDVELAKESKASIFTFGLGNCTQEVLKEAKHNSVKILQFDKVQTIIEILNGQSLNKHVDNN